ncbi:MAG: class I SAM-dependent methyltransferase [Planctomycetes bacterium]|nr:class I SAM-dependent methyltransferase [Planctomycetota bacterium]
MSEPGRRAGPDAATVHARNRRSWNAVTPAHQAHKQDQAGFLRGGGSTLFPEELELLGDVAGLDVVHLQCNCGQDSLSIAARGARVVGVDLADAAIDEARALSAASGIPARFERSEVVAWLAATARGGAPRFDVAFASYGALPWIPDLTAWVRGAAGVLRPGGRLAILEFHPFAWCVSATGEVVEPYFDDRPIEEPDGVRDYVGAAGDGLAPMGFRAADPDFHNPEPAVCFQWTVAGLLQAICDAGLRLTTIREWAHANGCPILGERMRKAGRRFYRAAGVPELPLMLGVVAERAPETT